MLLLGTVASYQDARRLGMHFRSFGKGTRLEEQPDGWAIWVFDDKDARWAKREFEVFKENPRDARFPTALSVLVGGAPATKQVIEMHLQGHSTHQIAATLNVYERKVRRILEHFESRFERQQRLPWE